MSWNCCRAPSVRNRLARGVGGAEEVVPSRVLHLGGIILRRSRLEKASVDEKGAQATGGMESEPGLDGEKERGDERWSEWSRGG